MSDALTDDMKQRLIAAIRKLKVENNWTQLQMAEMAGMKQSNFSLLIREHPDGMFSLTQIIRVYVALGGKVQLIIH